MDRLRETVKRAERAARNGADIPKAEKQVSTQDRPRSEAVFEDGIKNVQDLMRGMVLLMADIITQRVGSSVGNTMCNVVGKTLKATELQERYGKAPAGETKKVLKLVG